jgi:preprotein translocase SecE subunit
MNALKMYLINSYAEMRKVSWPTRQQTTAYSLLVIGLSLGLAIFFAVLDYGFNAGITTIIK